MSIPHPVRRNWLVARALWFENESPHFNPVMDIGYLPTRSMSQHMPILGLLGLNGDSLVSSITFSTFLTDTRIH